MSVDWTVLRIEYEEDGLSLRQLAAKYHISKSTIGQRKYEEHWQQPRPLDTRTPPVNPKPTTRDINAAVRVHDAITLYLQERPSWDDIAARCGYGSRGAAHNAVMRELERVISQDVTALRTEELYMITQLQARCYKVGIDEKSKDWTWAIDRFTALSKRKSELMGLDTPIENAASANLVVIREVPSTYLNGATPTTAVQESST